MHRFKRFYLRWKKIGKKVKFLNLIAVVGLFLVVLAGTLTAQTLYPQFSQSKSTVVKASVGTTHLSVSGYQSPYASIILKTQSGIFLSSTTADSKGYFSISNILINSSVLTYCFQAVDFKRLGISEACITLTSPITTDVTVNDIFLPPTIGLSKKVIDKGQDAVIYGYSMPGAQVLINLDGKVITVTADDTGYYTYIYKNVPEGVFRISAAASYNGISSLTPTYEVVLESKSVTQKAKEKAKQVITKIGKDVPFDWWPFIFAGLAFLTAIGILLYKLKFRPFVILIDLFKKKNKMHHDWFLEKW